MLSSYLVSKMTQHLHLTLSLSLILWEVKAADTHLSHLWTETKLALMTLDTFGVCQRPVFSLSVSQHMHDITNMLKFELNWSSKLQENNEGKTPLSLEVVCFQMLDFETSKSSLRSRNQIHGKLLLSWKLHYFRGSCFSQCFILSTSSPRKVLC